MREIKRFKVNGIPNFVSRADFAGRFVDFWAPDGGSDSIIIAHDGQNIFDHRTATRLRQTWQLTQHAIRIANQQKIRPPLVIAIFHSSTKRDPFGRILDLSPEDAFRSGITPSNPKIEISLDDLRGNQYLEQLFGEILPTIVERTNSVHTPESTAMIGSSMGGLASINAFGRYAEKFHTCLALSPHWVLAGEELVDFLISRLPNPKGRKLWMSRGTKGLDASYEYLQNRANQLVKKAGWDSSFTSRIYQGKRHNERAWASYVDQALEFWMRKS